MVFELNSAYVIILLSIPLQFNFITDSFDIILGDMKKDWKEKRDLTYYETYFAKKSTFYVGFVSAIVSIFVFYSVKKMRIVISILFFFEGLTWLLYFFANERKIYIFYIIRSIQGVYLGFFQTAGLPYIINFVEYESKCFYGNLIQFSMFVGLLIMNLMINYLSWKVLILIFFAMSLTFSGLIWLVPEKTIRPKKITNEHIRKDIRSIIIMIVAMLFQQLSGIGILLEELDLILNGIGLDIGPNFQACLFDFVGALSVIISAFISDIATTKYIWSISAFGLCIGLTIYAVSLKMNLANWISSLGVFVYFLFYGLGEGPIPWYLCCTLFQENVRIESSGINLFFNLFLSTFMDFVWKKLKEKFEQFGSILFASITCFIAIFFGIFGILNDNIEEDDNINLI